MVLVWMLLSITPTPHTTGEQSEETPPEHMKRGGPAAGQQENGGPANSTANLLLPVAGVTPDELTDTYNAPRGGGRSHEAIDIMAPADAPVVAAISGTIIRRYWSESGGRSLYQYGPDSARVYYYAHLNRYKPDVREGTSVARGDTLAFVGDSGNAPDGAHHLHFGIWMETKVGYFWDGRTINPYPALSEQSSPEARD